MSRNLSCYDWKDISLLVRILCTKSSLTYYSSFEELGIYNKASKVEVHVLLRRCELCYYLYIL